MFMAAFEASDAESAANLNSIAGRRQKRIKSVLPVKIWGLDADGQALNQPAHTLDVTPHGARIGGVTRRLKTNDVIGIARGATKTRCRVAWIVQNQKTRLWEIGIELLEPEKNLWNVNLPPAEADTIKNPVRKTTELPPQDAAASTSITSAPEAQEPAAGVVPPAEFAVVEVRADSEAAGDHAGDASAPGNRDAESPGTGVEEQPQPKAAHPCFDVAGEIPVEAQHTVAIHKSPAASGETAGGYNIGLTELSEIIAREFTNVRETLTRELSDMRAMVEMRLSALEISFQRHTDSVTAQMQAERSERIEANNKVTAALRDTSESLGQQIAELEDKTTSEDEMVRDNLGEIWVQLQDDMQCMREEFTALMDKQVDAPPVETVN